MEAAKFLQANPRLPCRRISPNHYPRTTPSVFFKTRKFTINAKQGEDEGKSSVDDNMVVLRMRIKKIKKDLVSNSSGDGNDGEMKATAEEDGKPWEKSLLARSQGSVGESMEALQSYLMKTKPNLALGMLALAVITVPLSGSPVMENAIKIARALLAGCHVSIDIHF